MDRTIAKTIAWATVYGPEGHWHNKGIRIDYDGCAAIVCLFLFKHFGLFSLLLQFFIFLVGFLKTIQRGLDFSGIGFG
jgi:hypothetical protein